MLALALAPAAVGRERSPADPHHPGAGRAGRLGPHRKASSSSTSTRGKTVFARNPDLPLAPASNEKLAVTYAALKELGPDYEFRTEVLGEGWQDGTVWHGSLVLKGFGDPVLDSGDLARLAGQLASAGIRRVTGQSDRRRVVVRQRAHRAGLEAVVLHGGVSAALGTRRRRRRRREPTSRCHRRSRPRRSSARPCAPGESRRAASRCGIGQTGATPLAQVDSEPLSDILIEMDHDSDNYVAELLLKELGAEVGGAGTTAAGDAVVDRVLAAAGVPLAGVHIVDGSGLSLDDRLTANAVASLLLLSWRDPDMRAVLWDALPVAGVSGTLQHRLLTGPAHGAVRAKTGTTDLASALSGYAGDRFAFSILQNGEPISFYWARLAQDRVAQALARVATQN